jgi:hyaluronoglucosaminidase
MGEPMDVELGVIEGYYGVPWTWAEREAQAAFLQAHGYGFYIYAPKADAFLRRRWPETPPAETQNGLLGLAQRCRELGVRFGVGLSPFEVYRDFNAEVREALARKLAWLDALGVEYLGVLFDDMRGDQPDLAGAQIRIMHWIAEHSGAGRIIFCPTYYSDDPALDRYFGTRPPDYLEALGAGLDPKIEIFWTGEEVCSREIGPGHLARVAETLRRKPFLWDNYPVNDGPRMCPYLHLRAFTGRPAANAEHIAGHAINPALQPWLTRIPALTLAENYRLGEAYEYGRAFDRAAVEVLGPDLAGLVRQDLARFQDDGLDRLGVGASALRERYGRIDHPAAREITAWLDGAYAVTLATMAGA